MVMNQISKIKDKNTYIERNIVFQTNNLLTTKKDDKDSKRTRNTCLA